MFNFLFLIFLTHSLMANELLKVMAPEIKSSDYYKIEKGNLVQYLKDLEGPWPESTIFTLLNATPKESMAVFVDFESQVGMIPDLKKLDVKCEPEQKFCSLFMIYEPGWPAPKTELVVKDVMEKFETDHYSIRWDQVTSNTSKVNRGSATFTKIGNKTLMKYVNYVEPTSKLAIVVESMAKSAVKKTVEIMKENIEKKSKNNPEQMQKLIEKMNSRFSVEAKKEKVVKR